MSWIYWDPAKDAFTLPFLDLAIAWYGIFFALGFVMGYFILLPLLQKVFIAKQGPSAKSLASVYADRLTWFVIIGTIIGARLGHVLFYEWPYYAAHPLEIIMLRHGGLASHGGTVGVMVALMLFLRWNRKKFPDLSFINLIDLLVIPTAFTVCCIRLGNFFNQEIIGYPTTLPWAIIFGHPADGGPVIPRHPTQLYEAGIYLMTFVVLLILWRAKGFSLKPGTFSGLFFILVFGSRFFIEFLKPPQSMVIDESFLQMSQYLSIPFVLLGIILMVMPFPTRVQGRSVGP